MIYANLSLIILKNAIFILQNGVIFELFSFFTRRQNFWKTFVSFAYLDFLQAK